MVSQCDGGGRRGGFIILLSVLLQAELYSDPRAVQLVGAISETFSVHKYLEQPRPSSAIFAVGGGGGEGNNTERNTETYTMDT